jgi:hypothetical protein
MTTTAPSPSTAIAVAEPAFTHREQLAAHLTYGPVHRSHAA